MKQELRTVPEVGIRYTLERKNVKNINLRVQRDGSVRASAHPSVAAERVDAFVAENAQRIRKVQERFRELPEPPPRQYVSGEVFYLLGQPLVLEILPARENEVTLEDGRLILKLRDGANREKLVERFLDSQCETVFGKIAEEVYPIFRDMGVKMLELRVRRMRSRWGSCMPGKGVITLNSQLLEKPEACIEYVMVHEFCHLIHPNHSRQFYALLTACLPDWQARKRMLNGKNGV